MLSIAVVDFIKLSLNDQTLQARQINLDLDGLVKLASELGYRFTVDEFSYTINALAANELSDEDLDQVAGGVAGGTSQPILISPNAQHIAANFYHRLLSRL